MTTTKFKLLQNLPFAKAGDIFNSQEQTFYFTVPKRSIDSLLSTLDLNFTLMHLRNTDWFEPIIEKPKPVLKYENGAVMEPTAITTNYYFIANGFVDEQPWNYESYQEARLLLRNVFLTKQEAQKALDMRLVQNRLLKKIREIDSDWVCNWSNNSQGKYCLVYDHEESEKYYDHSITGQCDQIYMSEQAKDYMMSDQVSLEDFKLFLSII
jgi:hypothetical protein